MSNFNEAAVNTVFDKIESYCMSLNRFETVNGHEPKSAPGSGVHAAVWAQSIRPAPRASGLAVTSGVVQFNVRMYTNFVSQPFDAIDPQVMAATADLMGALSGDFALGGDAGIREVDLLGSQGTPLSAAAGYIELDRKWYRVMTLTVPVIINDMFKQVA